MPRGVKLQKLVDTACSLDHRVMLLQLAQSHVGSILGALASPHHGHIPAACSLPCAPHRALTARRHDPTRLMGKDLHCKLLGCTACTESGTAVGHQLLL
jgi:hypothetical protein